MPGNLTGYKKKKTLNILEKIPQSLKDKIEASPNYYITVYPCKMVDKGNEDIGLKQMSSLHIYNKLISNKTRLPTGFLKWKEDFDITDGETKFAFTFVKSCSKSTFDHKTNSRYVFGLFLIFGCLIFLIYSFVFFS